MCYYSKKAQFKTYNIDCEYLKQNGEFTLFSVRNQKEMKEVIISTLISNKIHKISDIKGMTIIPRLVKSANNQKFYYRLHKDYFVGHYRLRNIHRHISYDAVDLHKIQMMYMSLYLTLTVHLLKDYRISLETSYFKVLVDDDGDCNRVLFFPYLPYYYPYSTPLEADVIERFTNTNFDLIHDGEPLRVVQSLSKYVPPKFDQTWISDKVFNDKASEFIRHIVESYKPK